MARYIMSDGCHHTYRWCLNDKDDALSAFALVDVELTCDCRNVDIEALARLLRMDLGWVVDLSAGVSVREGVCRLSEIYTFSVRRKGLKRTQGTMANLSDVIYRGATKCLVRAEF